MMSLGVRGVRPQRVLVCLFALLLVSLSPGCLFPPVATPVELDQPTTEGEDEEDLNVTPVYEQRFHLETQTGDMDAGLTLHEDMHGAQLHKFDLPQRLAVVRVDLEWNHTAYDLDLSASLSEGPGEPVLWADNDTSGGAGDPDAPVVLEVRERSKIFIEAPTQLSLTVSSDAAADVSYTLTVRATYLVPDF